MLSSHKQTLNNFNQQIKAKIVNINCYKLKQHNLSFDFDEQNCVCKFRQFNIKVDYYPSANKWTCKGEIHCGTVDMFMKFYLKLINEMV